MKINLKLAQITKEETKQALKEFGLSLDDKNVKFMNYNDDIGYCIIIINRQCALYLCIEIMKTCRREYKKYILSTVSYRI